MSEPENEAELMPRVDLFPGAHQPTEPDEEDVLRELYGEPDQDGVYKGVAG